MSLLSLLGAKPKPPSMPASTAETDRFNAVVELIYSGHALAHYLIVETENGPECICGAPFSSHPNPPQHTRFCPVNRFMTAVERTRKVAFHD